jgi:probable rRNA maturation factor
LISFSTADTAFKYKVKAPVRKWLELFSVSKSFVLSNLSVVFCSDEFLLKMNVEYLQHDFYTDIITFDYSDGKSISGELFISVDRVRDNAIALNKSFESELLRVIAHGVLHLMGYKDKSKADQKKMRSEEDAAILLYSGLF